MSIFIIFHSVILNHVSVPVQVPSHKGFPVYLEEDDIHPVLGNYTEVSEYSENMQYLFQSL